MSSACLVPCIRTIVNCNCSFEDGDGGYGTDECSDDGESRL